MQINPELQRNIWLQISPSRLLLFPMLVVGSSYMLSLIDLVGSRLSGLLAFWVFILLTAGVGASRAGNAILSEISGRTWSLQRLTAISPWSMIWGKLIGSSILCWYGGAWCLGVFIINKSQLPPGIFNVLFFSEGLVPGLFFMIGVGLLSQILGMMAGMAQLRNEKLSSKRFFPDNIMAILLPISIFILIFWVDVFTSKNVIWYDGRYSTTYFWLASLFVAIAWCLTGLYLLMRREFDMPNLPFVWLGFCVFIIFYCMGFEYSFLGQISGEHALLLKQIVIGFGFSLLITYLMLIWEKTDGFALRQLFLKIKSRCFREALYDVPRGFLTVFLAWGMGGWLTLTYIVYSDTFSPSTLNPLGFVGGALCFMMRDLAAFLYLNLSEKSRYSIPSFMFFIILFYLVLPVIFYFFNIAEWISLFYPVYKPVSPLVAILPSFTQALFMWALVYMRWKDSAFCKSRLQCG